STKYGTGMTRTATGAAVSEVLPPEESEKESGEGTDRATLNYSGVQLELFAELMNTGKPVVVVPIQGRPLLMNEFSEHADAILLAWYPGMFGGRAIAEALFGEYNPSGRLPVSLPRAEGQLPVNYNSLEKRPNYVDLTSAPLYPFGFGMSYTDFSHEDFRIEDRILSVNVTNTGSETGEDVIQFYLTALDSPVQRPHLELIGFQRIMLAPGESRTVSLNLSEKMLGCYDRNGDFIFSGGYYDFHVGEDCERLKTLSGIWIPSMI
ncbi:MAG: glycoside hydrolase family 3 C-terminal domain-containing protein, partial [Lentisphaeria bacterium]|nr:glycoside hydrolase family 3 C-terminal domain-containing protein [Lentisphaeria bacterium]